MFDLFSYIIGGISGVSITALTAAGYLEHYKATYHPVLEYPPPHYNLTLVNGPQPPVVITDIETFEKLT